MMHRAISILFFCTLTGSFAQETAQGEVFSRAVRFYTAGEYDSTIAVIRAHLTQFGKSPEAEYLVPLIMEAYLRKGDYAPVNRLFDLYRKKFRSSAFMPRVWYLRGYAQAKERSYASAFESFSMALEGGVSDEIDSLIVAGVEAICASAIDVGALHDAGRESDNHRCIREMARYYEIRRLMAEGEVGRAKKYLGEFKNEFSPSRFDVQIGDFLNAVQLKKEGVIGLLAPLSGEDAEVGKRIAQGIQLAVDRYNAQRPVQIRAISYDTKGALLETARKTAKLLDSDRVSLIIGPMLSSTAIVTAATLLGRNAVMLSPTATDEGIAELGPNIFQMNITLGVLARKVARYALDNLNIREFAIIAPRSGYGTTMASIFRDEIGRGGGTLFHEEFFDEGSNDFTRQFIDLRHKLLLRRLEQDDRARGKNVKPRTKISAGDSLKWADSSVSIGAIFMPADPENVVMLAPQVAFNRIKAQLLGSNGWHSPKTLADGKQYVLNAVISAFFEPDSSWKKWPEFRREYHAQYGEEPDRAAALGFDAGNIGIRALENAGGSNIAPRIAESIASTRKYEGASGIISFDRATRTNSEAVILKLTPNGFVRVQ